MNELSTVTVFVVLMSEKFQFPQLIQRAKPPEPPVTHDTDPRNPLARPKSAGIHQHALDSGGTESLHAGPPFSPPAWSTMPL